MSMNRRTASRRAVSRCRCRPGCLAPRVKYLPTMARRYGSWRRAARGSRAPALAAQAPTTCPRGQVQLGRLAAHRGPRPVRPDGYLTLTDEVKDVTQSGDEWSSVEVEKGLMVYSAVAEAAVIGVADDRWRERPLAVVVGKTDVPAAYSNCCTLSATRVAGWQVPERWTSVETIVRSEPAPTSQKRAGLARTRALSSGSEGGAELHRGSVHTRAL